MNTNPSRRGGTHKAVHAGKHTAARNHAGAASPARNCARTALPPQADDYGRDAARYHEGAHASRPRPARKPSGRKRAVLAAACCVALLTLCVSGAYAWFAQQDAKTNAFVKGETTPVINEEFPQDGTVKQNVFVSIPDDCIDVWVRAQVNVQWQGKEDDKGNTPILWDEPVAGASGDYAIEWALDEDGAPNQNGDPASWVKGADGFYYWTVPLVAKNSATNKTGNLVNRVEVLKKYDDGRQLVVDVAAQTLSASAAAFNDAWATSGFVAVDATGDAPAHLTVKSATAQDADAAQEGGSHEAA